LAHFDEIADLSMGSSSFNDMRRYGKNLNNSELTGNNREYQGIFAKKNRAQRRAHVSMLMFSRSHGLAQDCKRVSLIR
jgi:hypothetical protein